MLPGVSAPPAPSTWHLGHSHRPPRPELREHSPQVPSSRGNCWINTLPQQRWRWQAVAGRAPGGTELFLHSKASPSRPGERRQLTAAATAHSPPTTHPSHRQLPGAHLPSPAQRANGPADGGPSIVAHQAAARVTSRGLCLGQAWSLSHQQGQGEGGPHPLPSTAQVCGHESTGLSLSKDSTRGFLWGPSRGLTLSDTAPSPGPSPDP